jgi:hypothetical protein
MTSPGARRVTEALTEPQTDESMRWVPEGSEAAAQGEAEAAARFPDSAAIAEESAAIYPDTIEGPPTPEEIAIEAYRIYMARGAAHGSDLEDWLEAERRLSAIRRTTP